MAAIHTPFDGLPITHGEELRLGERPQRARGELPSGARREQGRVEEVGQPDARTRGDERRSRPCARPRGSSRTPSAPSPPRSNAAGGPRRRCPRRRRSGSSGRGAIFGATSTSEGGGRSPLRTATAAVCMRYDGSESQPARPRRRDSRTDRSPAPSATTARRRGVPRRRFHHHLAADGEAEAADAPVPNVRPPGEEGDSGVDVLRAAPAEHVRVAVAVLHSRACRASGRRSRWRTSARACAARPPLPGKTITAAPFREVTYRP